MPKQQLIYNVYFEDESYTCTVDVSYHVDGNYGSDADGNRGVRRLFIDDVHIVEVLSNHEDYMNLKEIPKELKEKIIQAVEEHI